jgi:hypothetical protein
MDEVLASAVAERRWPIVAAALIWFIIAAMKSKRIPFDIPKRAQPYVAIALGIGSGVAESFIAGMPLLDAVLGGFVAGALAIATQETVVPAAQAAKDSLRPPPLALLAFALVTFGCGGAVSKFEAVAHSARDVAVVAEACSFAAKEQAMSKCIDDGCRAQVLSQYSAIADALDAFHLAWCSAAPEAEGCK